MRVLKNIIKPKGEQSLLGFFMGIAAKCNAFKGYILLKNSHLKLHFPI